MKILFGKTFYRILKFLIPHFFTESFAINIDEEGFWDIYCLYDELTAADDGNYDYFGVISGFTWLGIGINLRLINIFDLEGNLLTAEE